jgi:TRAP-type C4-dicarboxylate transport system permease small subunit
MLSRTLGKIEEYLIGSLIAAATLIVFVAVLHRYSLSNLVHLMVFAKSHDYGLLLAAARSVFKFINSYRLPWAQELCIFMFIWMAKFGAAYGVRTGIHVGVDVLVNRLTGGYRRAVILVSLAAGALFTGLIALLGARFVSHIAETGQTSAVLELPMWMVYLAVPLGSALMCLRFVEAAFAFHRTGSLPKHGLGEFEELDSAHGGEMR